MYKTVKLKLRNAYAAGLNAVPDSWLLRLRSAYVRAGDGTISKHLAHCGLRLIRYKHPDRRASSFPLVDEPRVRLENVNSIIVRHAYWFGVTGWEGGQVRAWQYFCSSAKRILEVGANVGFYTVCGAVVSRAEYTAVEPHPLTVQILRRNLEINLVEHVTVRQTALVGIKTAPTLKLAVPATDQDDAPPGSFLASGGERMKASGASYDVAITAARDLFAGEPDLVKLDTEGYEFEILNAVKDIVLRTRPIIFVEVLPASSKLRALIADLVAAGAYRPFVCDGRFQEIDIAAVGTPALAHRHRTHDVALVPAETASGLPRDIPKV